MNVPHNEYRTKKGIFNDLKVYIANIQILPNATQASIGLLYYQEIT